MTIMPRIVAHLDHSLAFGVQLVLKLKQKSCLHPRRKVKALETGTTYLPPHRNLWTERNKGEDI